MIRMDIKITEDQSITSFQERVEKNYQYANKNYNCKLLKSLQLLCQVTLMSVYNVFRLLNLYLQTRLT